jgi:hypothetical protein
MAGLETPSIRRLQRAKRIDLAWHSECGPQPDERHAKSSAYGNLRLPLWVACSACGQPYFGNLRRGARLA